MRPVMLRLAVSSVAAVFAACGGQSSTTGGTEGDSPVVTPAGGTVSLGGFATVTFPPAAFPAARSVRLEATSAAGTALVFDLSTAGGAAGTRAAQELRINTGSSAPKSETVVVRLSVPADLAVPSGNAVSGFVEVFEGNDEDVHDVFVAAPSVFDGSSHTVVVSVPSFAFASSRTVDKTFEAVVVVASAPSPAGAASNRYAAASTSGCPKDVSRFRPPLERSLHVTSGFSNTRSNTAVGITTTGHPGVDLEAAVGETVVAVGDGVVVDARQSNGKSGTDDNGGFGGTVLLRVDGEGYVRYAHLEEGSLTVKKGDTVTAGQQIGNSGKTGAAAGPHLHLEYKPDTRADRIDPFPCIDLGYEGTFTFTLTDSGLTVFTAKGDLRLHLRLDDAAVARYELAKTTAILTSTFETTSLSCAVAPPTGTVDRGALLFQKALHPGTYLLAFAADWPATFTCKNKTTGESATFPSVVPLDFAPANCAGPVYLPLSDPSSIKDEFASGCPSTTVKASWDLKHLTAAP